MYLYFEEKTLNSSKYFTSRYSLLARISFNSAMVFPSGIVGSSAMASAIERDLEWRASGGKSQVTVKRDERFLDLIQDQRRRRRRKII